MGKNISGVPQNSILGPLLLNIFLCELFMEQKDRYFIYYGDDTTSYVVANNTVEVDNTAQLKLR